MLIALVQLKGTWRTYCWCRPCTWPSFTWETVLIANYQVTRQISIGAILIAMMTARPQGLLGSRRVEVPA